jgi:hypothetical protein
LATQSDDTVGVTFVMSVQVGFAALALLLFLEARSVRRARHRSDVVGDALHEFRPDMIVRWDDEFLKGGTECHRSPVANVRTARRRFARTMVDAVAAD